MLGSVVQRAEDPSWVLLQDDECLQGRLGQTTTRSVSAPQRQLLSREHTARHVAQHSWSGPCYRSYPTFYEVVSCVDTMLVVLLVVLLT